MIHGLEDPLVRIECGRDIAATVPGAELLEIPGMGHEITPGVHGILVDAISAHTRKAEAERG